MTLRGSWTSTGGYVRLLCREEERHKPLCFDSPGERWECLAPSISSGDALELAKVLFTGHHAPGVIHVCYECFGEVCGDPRCRCTSQCTLSVRDVARLPECLPVCRNCNTIGPCCLLISLSLF